jgi:alkane 1-monooxygenase
MTADPGRVVHLLPRCGSALAYTLPALLALSAALGAWTGRIDLFAWRPLAVLLGLVPIADYALGRDSSNPMPAQAVRLEASPGLRLPTLLALPVHLGVLAWSGRHFATTPFATTGHVGWLLAQGVVGGVLAINTAHELIHNHSRLERAAGSVLLASARYHGFKVEHLRGHRVHVATPEDASRARVGQTVSAFVPQALVRNTHRARRLEGERLARPARPRGMGNELIGRSALYLVLLTAFAWWRGTTGLVFFIVRGLAAAVSLEIINCIEHYGLERVRLPDGGYERTTQPALVEFRLPALELAAVPSAAPFGPPRRAAAVRSGAAPPSRQPAVVGRLRRDVRARARAATVVPHRAPGARAMTPTAPSGAVPERGHALRRGAHQLVDLIRRCGLSMWIVDPDPSRGLVGPLHPDPRTLRISM